jgi:hypothetical protein
VLAPRATPVVGIAVATALYFATGVYKVWLLVWGEHANAGRAAAAPLVADDDLPDYTVLVPLHHKGKILPRAG